MIIPYSRVLCALFISIYHSFYIHLVVLFFRARTLKMPIPSSMQCIHLQIAHTYNNKNNSILSHDQVSKSVTIETSLPSFMLHIKLLNCVAHNFIFDNFDVLRLHLVVRVTFVLFDPLFIHFANSFMIDLLPFLAFTLYLIHFSLKFPNSNQSRFVITISFASET